MTAAETLRRARRDAGLTLRSLAGLAGTSHSTLSAYEAGTKQPSVATFDRILRAAGYAVDLDLRRRIHGFADYPRSQELADVLGLAVMFPTRHQPTLAYPPFGRR